MSYAEVGLVRRGQWVADVHDVDGTFLRREVIDNAATTAGLNHLLATEYGGGSQVSAWYMGLVNNSGFSTFAAADTMGSHSGWSELTGYSESTRQEWVEAGASGGIMGTTTVATFTANATIAVKGAFLTSDSTKGGTTGTLAATGAFSNVQNLTSGQTLRLSYTVTLTSS